MVSLQDKKQAAKFLINNFKVSTRFVCRVLKLRRNTFTYQAKSRRHELEKQVIELSYRYPRWGYRTVRNYLKLQDVRISYETVQIGRAHV